MLFSSDIAGTPVGTLDASMIGAQPITFTLAGKGELIWQLDSRALAQALAGKSELAFQTIIKGFPAVEEAKARITPFWRHSFPIDASTIKVTVEPAPTQF